MCIGVCGSDDTYTFDDIESKCSEDTSVFEIKVLCCAPVGCKDSKEGVTRYINLFKSWKKHAHTGCKGLKIYAPCSQNVHTW